MERLRLPVTQRHSVAAARGAHIAVLKIAATKATKAHDQPIIQHPFGPLVVISSELCVQRDFVR